MLIVKVLLPWFEWCKAFQNPSRIDWDIANRFFQISVPRKNETKAKDFDVFFWMCGVVLWGHFKDTNHKSLVMKKKLGFIKKSQFMTNWCFVGTFWDIQAQGAAPRHQLSDLGLSKLLYYIIIELEKKSR